MPVAPRIGNDVHFSWQAQHLVRLKVDACCSAHCKCKSSECNHAQARQPAFPDRRNRNGLGLNSHRSRHTNSPCHLYMLVIPQDAIHVKPRLSQLIQFFC